MIGRSQLHIMFEEQSNAFFLQSLDLDLVDLRNLFNFLALFRIVILRFVDLLALVTLLQAGVLGTQHAFDLRELPCLICFTL